MLLEGKTAVIYGAGSIGGAVARVFAREGGGVFLVSRTRDRLEEVAHEIRAARGAATPRRSMPLTSGRSTSTPTL